MDTFGEMTSARAYARNRACDFARYGGVSHRSLLARGHAVARATRTCERDGKRGLLMRKEKRNSEKERKKAHIDIYFVDPRAFAERHSFRDGVASGAHTGPGTS